MYVFSHHPNHSDYTKNGASGVELGPSSIHEFSPQIDRRLRDRQVERLGSDDGGDGGGRDRGRVTCIYTSTRDRCHSTSCPVSWGTGLSPCSSTSTSFKWYRSTSPLTVDLDWSHRPVVDLEPTGGDPSPVRGDTQEDVHGVTLQRGSSVLLPPPPSSSPPPPPSPPSTEGPSTTPPTLRSLSSPVVPGGFRHGPRPTLFSTPRGPHSVTRKGRLTNKGGILVSLLVTVSLILSRSVKSVPNGQDGEVHTLHMVTIGNFTKTHHTLY